MDFVPRQLILHNPLHGPSLDNFKNNYLIFQAQLFHFVPNNYLTHFPLPTNMGMKRQSNMRLFMFTIFILTQIKLALTHK
jgi:hypothetical protein